MSAGKRQPADRHVRETLLREYAPLHSKAQVDVKRYNSVSVRVRIIDPDFTGQSSRARDDAVWRVLDTMSEDAQAEVSLLILLTPEETRASLMNREFEDPAPARL